MDLKPLIRAALWGAITGDALGLPVQFLSREQVRAKKVTGMTGNGAFNLPPGSWSDDSSLMLCTTDSLLAGFDTADMAGRFVRWLEEGYWTPYGYAYDIGGTTLKAVTDLAHGAAPELAGGAEEGDNGNGSLMRILPIALRYYNCPTVELLDYAHRASCLTHRHPRAQMACGIYCLIAAELLKGRGLEAAMAGTVQTANQHYNAPPFLAEWPHFERVFSGGLHEFPEEAIASGGYVIETLEAALWTLLTTTSYREAILKAVNLGWDTDTTAIVTGGLAGIIYGMESIPEEWLAEIKRRDEIEELFQRFISDQTFMESR
jgi:ADP-ribosyl-[dinitrogen reductase] hydrolase